MNRHAKRWLLCLIALFLLPVYAETGNTAWTVDKARQEVLKDIFSQAFEMRIFPTRDPDYVENKQARLQGLSEVKARHLTYFNDDSYGVTENGSVLVYYYDQNGDLKSIAQGWETTYPYKSYRFLYPSGKLVTVSFVISPTESYIFRPSGELAAHWVGHDCYNAQGKTIISR
jgi:hypothetical protein